MNHQPAKQQQQCQQSWNNPSCWMNGSSSSDNGNDSDLFLGDIMDEDPTNNRNNAIDAWMIPSAANLTRDVFDEEEDDADILKPANVAFDNRMRQHQRQQQQQQRTNLNSTLSYGLLGNLVAASNAGL
jgi:hypothetical protein